MKDTFNKHDGSEQSVNTYNVRCGLNTFNGSNLICKNNNSLTCQFLKANNRERTALRYLSTNSRELHENNISETRLGIVRNSDSPNISAIIKNNGFVVLSEFFCWSHGINICLLYKNWACFALTDDRSGESCHPWRPSNSGGSGQYPCRSCRPGSNTNGTEHFEVVNVDGRTRSSVFSGTF